MSDITGLEKSILEQSHEKGRLNLAAAQARLEADFEQKKAQLLLEKKGQRDKLLNDIEREFQKEKQDIENQARQSSLVAKQAVLTELFETAEAQMGAWSQEEQLAFFKRVMANCQGKVSVRFGEKTLETFSQATWDDLVSSYPHIDFDKEPIAQEAGFIISRGRVDENYLYSTLIKHFRDREGFRLAAEIFPAE